jgi:hypothetical protein
LLAGDVSDGLWERLFHAPAVRTLLRVLDDHQPLVVLTTNWLRFLDLQGFEELFVKTGLAKVEAALCPTAWEAPQNRGNSRLEAIEAWMSAHHDGEPFVILDDTLSGTGLARSRFDRRGAVVLCEVGVGLTEAHLDAVRRALGVAIERRTNLSKSFRKPRHCQFLMGRPWHLNRRGFVAKQWPTSRWTQRCWPTRRRLTLSPRTFL